MDNGGAGGRFGGLAGVVKVGYVDPGRAGVEATAPRSDAPAGITDGSRVGRVAGAAVAAQASAGLTAAKGWPRSS